MSSEAQTLINFYARQGYFRHVQAVCNDSLKKRGDDPVLIFWKAFGILNEGNSCDEQKVIYMFKGNISEAIREFESINGKRDVQLAVTCALIVAHSRFARTGEQTRKVPFTNHSFANRQRSCRIAH
jgi:tetratricopeptide repeat protein 21B